MPLSDTSIRNAKSPEKPIKLADGGGLYLLLKPNGAKWWRLDYRFAGKRKTLSMGVYPEVGLKAARDKRDEAKRLLADGIDPGENRKIQKAARTERSENSFEVVAREWFAKFSPNWADSHAVKIIRRLERDVFPWLGARPIAEIKAPGNGSPCVAKLQSDISICSGTWLVRERSIDRSAGSSSSRQRTAFRGNY